MNDSLFQEFDRLAQAPGGVARLRELILSLAVRGKLVPQDQGDEPASVLLRRIHEEKESLAAAGKIKRDKASPTIAMDDVPFGLPDSWVWSRLGTVAKKITDGTHHSPANFASGDFKYLSAKNIKSWGIDLTGVTYVPTSVHQEIYARCDPEHGDILYIKDGATTGVLTINTLKEQFSLLSSVGVVKPSCGVTSEYLALLMRSPFFYQAVRDGMTGVAITRVTLSKLGAAFVPLPPLAEQSRIVARVDELMRLCDALEAKDRLEAEQHTRLLDTLLGTLTDSATPEELAANWQRVAEHFDLLLDRPEAVDALEQTVLQLAVRGLLVPQDPSDEPASVLLHRIRAEKDRLIADGRIKPDKTLSAATDLHPFEIPETWTWVPMGEVVEIVRGITFPASEKTREAAQGRIACLRTANVQESIEWSDLLFVNRSFMGREDQLLKLHDIVMSMANSRELVGKVALVDHIPHAESTFGGFLGVLRPWKIDPRYAMALLRSSYARSTLIDSSSQTTNIANISLGKLRPLPFPLPPLAEQARIVARVTDLRRLCADLRQRLATSQATQSRLAEALVESVASVASV